MIINLNTLLFFNLKSNKHKEENKVHSNCNKLLKTFLHKNLCFKMIMKLIIIIHNTQRLKNIHRQEKNRRKNHLNVRIMSKTNSQTWLLKIVKVVIQANVKTLICPDKMNR